MNRTFEWGVVIAPLLSVLSIVPRRCARVTSPPPLQPPPPGGGDRHLAQKAEETLGTEEKISLRYTGVGVGGDRHLLTVPPPPPHGGDRPDIRGGDYKGGGGYLLHPKLRTFKAVPIAYSYPAAPATRRKRPLPVSSGAQRHQIQSRRAQAHFAPHPPHPPWVPHRNVFRVRSAGPCGSVARQRARVGGRAQSLPRGRRLCDPQSLGACALGWPKGGDSLLGAEGAEDVRPPRRVVVR